MFDRLSEDQRQVLNIVREGYNVFITGQGGTKKSFLVKEIYKELTRSGKRVAIICWLIDWLIDSLVFEYGNFISYVTSLHESRMEKEVDTVQLH